MVAVPGLLQCANPVNLAGSDASKEVTFFCRAGKSIEARFYPQDDTRVDLKLSDGRNLSVPHAISADGARYATADESFVFWNRGRTAFITEGSPDRETYSDCVEEHAAN